MAVGLVSLYAGGFAFRSVLRESRKAGRGPDGPIGGPPGEEEAR